MGEWHRSHLDETVTAFATPEQGRFVVNLHEPPGGSRPPFEFYRSNLHEAQRAADRLVQAYYPHDCAERRCGEWRKSPD
jgi:hypothetical protein